MVSVVHGRYNLMTIFHYDNFPYEILENPPVINRKYRKQNYVNLISTFDIETTNLDDIKQAIMWHWQACVDGLVVTGREWWEFWEFLCQLDIVLPDNVVMPWYCHNLSFEFQHLRAIYDFQPEDVFCVSGRKVVKATIANRFEFRCSLFLTNMSLRQFCHVMRVENEKTEMNYNVQRFPWSDVSDAELEYCVNDVVGLWQALTKKFKIDNVDVGNVPMSATGYVRQDFKKAMNADKDAKRIVKDAAPDWETYIALRRCFRGGNTHSNRYYTSIVMDDVSSMDMASAYPAAVCNMPYPVTKFYRCGIKKIDKLDEDIPYLLHIKFTKIKLRNDLEGCPYLAIHKCQDTIGIINDNGRIIRADALTTYLTDIDLHIVQDMYVWDDAKIIEAWESEYGLLPKPMRETTMEYFRRKTLLKGATGEDAFLYDKAKAHLNSIYGMTATNPVRTSLIFNGADFSVVEEDPATILEEANTKAFSLYCWGVWTTCWCRYWLHRATTLAGNHFIYCDTDSVKYVGNVDFSQLNAEIQAISEARGSYAFDATGKKYYLNVFCPDAHYQKFCTLGAKKYAYVDDDGKFHITIAGVSKSGAEEMKTIDNFAEGFKFVQSAGMEAWYNDQKREEWQTITIDGHNITLTPNVYLCTGEYELGLTNEYKMLFNLSQDMLDRIRKTL